MSAERLREAAALIRADADAVALPLTSPFMAAVADWLEEVAAWQDEGLGICPDICRTNYPDAFGGIARQALAVADAYLGGQRRPAYATDEGVWRERIISVCRDRDNEHTRRVKADVDREQARGFCRLLHQRATQGLPVLPAVQLPEWMLPVPEPRETS